MSTFTGPYSPEYLSSRKILKEVSPRQTPQIGSGAVGKTSSKKSKAQKKREKKRRQLVNELDESEGTNIVEKKNDENDKSDMTYEGTLENASTNVAQKNNLDQGNSASQNFPFTFVPFLNIGGITSFGGTSHENVEDWLRQFDWMANINHWTDEIRSAQFPMYLTGTAKAWYDTIKFQDKTNFATLRNGLSVAFKPMDSPVKQLQELISRVQKEGESVDNYAFAKLALCNRVNPNMDDRDRMSHFIQGLLSPIQDFVATSSAKNFKDALAVAKKKENVLSFPKVDKDVKKIDSKEETSGLRQLFAELKEELQAKVEDRIRRLERTGQDQQNRWRDPQRPKGSGFRTTDGRVICLRCEKVGHYARVCPERDDAKSQMSKDDRKKPFREDDQDGKRKREEQDDKDRKGRRQFDQKNPIRKTNDRPEKERNH